MKNDVEYKYGDPWITPERNKNAGKLFKVVSTDHSGDRNRPYNCEPAWFIGRTEGGKPDDWIKVGTVGLLVSCVIDRWIVLIGERKFHMHENSLELLEEKDRINWRHLNHAES